MIIVRKGTSADMEAAHQLVTELAIFEKEEAAVKTSPEIYRKDFENNCFELLVAEVDKKIVGIALYFPTYSTWKGKAMYLDDLIVTKEYRGRGVGKQLLDEFIATAKARGSKRIMWQVLDWNENAIRFYERYDVEFVDNWVNCFLHYPE